MLDRLYLYASESGYTKYTCTKKEEWLMCLREPAKVLIEYLQNHDEPDVIHVDEKFEDNPSAALGVLEAKRHRKRGIRFDMFMGLSKLVRQAFIDLICETYPTGEERKNATAITLRFFDKFELGFCSEWVRQQETDVTKELQDTNRSMTNGKNRYLTIFQSMAEPALMVDSEMYLLEINEALEKFLGISNTQIKGKKCNEVLACGLCDACPLEKAIKENSSFNSLETAIPVRGEEKIVLVSGSFLDDFSDKYTGGIVVLQDITERKQAEEEIQKKEACLREAQAIAHVGSWEWDILSDKEWWSEETYRIFGVQPENFTPNYNNFINLIHPDDRDMVAKAVEAGTNDDKPFEIIYRIARPDGNESILNSRGMVVRNEQGNPIRMIGTCHDITERKLAEQALQKSESRFRRLYDSNILGIVFWNINGEITDANDYYLNMIGYSRDELQNGKINWEKMTPPEYDHLVKKGIEELKATGICSPFEKEYIKKDGTRVPIIIGGASLEGETEAGVTFTLDITERKRMEEALANLSAEQQLIFDSVPAMIWYKDLKNNFIRVNKTGAESAGMRVEDIEGKSAYDLFPEAAEKYYQDDLKVINSGKPKLGIIETMKTASGKTKWVCTDKILYRDEHGKPVGLIVFVTDITERKQAEEELTQHREHLEELVEERTAELEQTHEQLLHAEKLGAIGKLSGSIAHEFNNPLFGIMNVLGRLKRNKTFDKTDKEHLDIAIDECKRIKSLIINLQDFNRPTSGVVAPMDIHKTLDDMLFLCKKQFSTRKIKIRRYYAPDMPNIHAVEDQIKQVILNLLNNANEAIPDDGGAIRIKTETFGKKVAIHIHDSGMGIKSKDKNLLFEPFFTTKSAVKGTGLGLSVSYGIIKKHGGEITFETKPGKGTAFTVTLPIKGALK